jgi:hypothetical protein
VAEAKKKEVASPDPKLAGAIGRLEKAYGEWEKLPAETEPQRAKKSEGYTRILDIIRGVLERMPSSDPDLPVSKINWGGLDAGRASSVTANPLTRKGAGGSKPEEPILGWDTSVREARIRAHLLHHNLHGPGRRFNLTPTSSQTNQLMYNRVEKHALKAVQAGHQLIYSTQVKYDNSQKGAWKDVAKHLKISAKNKKTKEVVGEWEGDNF